MVNDGLQKLCVYTDELIVVQKDVADKDVNKAAWEAMRRIVDQLETIENPPELIQQKLLELALELHTVNGKKQYGYLKKPLKDMLDFIVDELEKMPEVATYYSIWNDLRDTLESYYKSRSGQAQSAFAAERISRNQERHYSSSGAFALSARRFFCTDFYKSDTCR